MTDSVRAEAQGGAAVDAIINSRVGLGSLSWIWPLVRPMVNAMVSRNAAVEFVNAVQGLDPDGFFDYFNSRLSIDVSTEGLANLPSSGPLIIVANHPTGAVDGLVLHLALKKVRRDLAFFSSTEALTLVPSIEDCIIPVELHSDRRDIMAQRRMVKAFRNALREGRSIVMLPAGELSVKKEGQLVERNWSLSAVNLAHRHQLPILPIHIGGKNSRLHYALHHISPVLRDLTTFRETLNKRGSKFNVRIGKLVSPAEIGDDPIEATERLRKSVMLDLASPLPKTVASS